jgi:hypothetical protein
MHTASTQAAPSVPRASCATVSVCPRSCLRVARGGGADRCLPFVHAAASFPLFGGYMFKGMGYQYAGTLLSALATLAIPFPFFLYKYGPTIRKNSRFAAAVTGANDNDDASDEEKGGSKSGETRKTPSTVDEGEDEEAGHTDVDEIDEDDARALEALEQEAGGASSTIEGDRTAVNSREPSVDDGAAARKKTLAI